jgi:hypothetical protein
MSAHSDFGRNRTTATGTLLEDLHAFLRAEVTGWGVSTGESPDIDKCQAYLHFLLCSKYVIYCADSWRLAQGYLLLGCLLRITLSSCVVAFIISIGLYIQL